MAQPGLVLRFEAKPESADQFNEILTQALPYVEAETGTRPWLTFRDEADPSVFFLVDAFSSDDARQAHLGGEAAKLILGTGGDLLASEPTVNQVQTVAVKA